MSVSVGAEFTSRTVSLLELSAGIVVATIGRLDSQVIKGSQGWRFVESDLSRGVRRLGERGL